MVQSISPRIREKNLVFFVFFFNPGCQSDSYARDPLPVPSPVPEPCRCLPASAPVPRRLSTSTSTFTAPPRYSSPPAQASDSPGSLDRERPAPALLVYPTPHLRSVHLFPSLFSSPSSNYPFPPRRTTSFLSEPRGDETAKQRPPSSPHHGRKRTPAAGLGRHSHALAAVPQHARRGQ